MTISRRRVLELALGSPLWAAAAQDRAAVRTHFDQAALADAPGAVFGPDATRLARVELVRDWDGPFCRSRIVNRGAAPAPVKEVVLADIELDVPEWMFRIGVDRAKLLADLADRLALHHSPLRTPSPPTGWCSWYCSGRTSLRRRSWRISTSSRTACLR